MREYDSDDMTPVIYHDGTVWFHLFDPDNNGIAPARAVCFTDEFDAGDNEPFAWPFTVSNEPTATPTHRTSGRTLRCLRWATPHDIHPDL
jgi:hypothetical protein